VGRHRRTHHDDRRNEAARHLVLGDVADEDRGRGTRDGARDGFSEFSINRVAFSMDKMEPMFRLTRGKRYRLHMLNATDDVHPMHLHRHSFELTNVAGKPISGLIKDVAMIGAFQEMSVDLTADQPGLSLFHCHMQHHMDFGFMALLDCT